MRWDFIGADVQRLRELRRMSAVSARTSRRVPKNGRLIPRPGFGCTTDGYMPLDRNDSSQERMTREAQVSCPNVVRAKAAN